MPWLTASSTKPRSLGWRLICSSGGTCGGGGTCSCGGGSGDCGSCDGASGDGEEWMTRLDLVVVLEMGSGKVTNPLVEQMAVDT